ncbi:MAG: Holliday junction resolvase RuvX [Vampirovibrionia bacterium]
MKRILSLDVGKRRIGIAISAPLNLFTKGLPTIRRSPESEAIKTIAKAIKEYDAGSIVVGLPLNMDGTTGEQAEDVKGFIERLTEQINIDIIFQDERLTSFSAEELLIEQGISPSKNKGLIDQKAAEIILEEYLNSLNKRKEAENEQRE